MYPMDFQQKILNQPQDLEKLDIDFQIEIAQKNIPFSEVLALKEGGVFVFDDSIDTPLAVMIHEEKIAEGVLIKTQNGYGIKITKTLIELE